MFCRCTTRFTVNAILWLADHARQFDLVRVRFGAGNPVGGVLARILKADLNVIESGVDQRLAVCVSFRPMPEVIRLV